MTIIGRVYATKTRGKGRRKPKTELPVSGALRELFEYIDKKEITYTSIGWFLRMDGQNLSRWRRGQNDPSIIHIEAIAETVGCRFELVRVDEPSPLLLERQSTNKPTNSPTSASYLLKELSEIAKDRNILDGSIDNLLDRSSAMKRWRSGRNAPTIKSVEQLAAILGYKLTLKPIKNAEN